MTVTIPSAHIYKAQYNVVDKENQSPYKAQDNVRLEPTELPSRAARARPISSPSVAWAATRSVSFLSSSINCSTPTYSIGDFLLSSLICSIDFPSEKPTKQLPSYTSISSRQGAKSNLSIPPDCTRSVRLISPYDFEGDLEENKNIVDFPFYIYSHVHI